MSDFKAKMHQNPMLAGALLQTPLWELTMLPKPTSWIFTELPDPLAAFKRTYF